MYTIKFTNNNASITKPMVTFIQATHVVAQPTPSSPNAKVTQLVGPPLAATAMIKGQLTSLVNGTSYELDDIDSTLQMNPESWQGHMYISDAALTPPTSGGLPVDMAYTSTRDTGRYQYLEFAGSTSTASVDITYINWYCFPLQMQSTTQQASQTRGAPLSSANLSHLQAKLAALSDNNVATVVKNASNQIVRVISPNAGNPKWLPLYLSFSNYLASVFIDSVQQIPINNLYSGHSKPPSPDYERQNYQTSSVTYGGQTLKIQGTTSLLGDFTMSSEMFWQQFNSVIYLSVMNYSWSYAGQGKIAGASNLNGNTGDNNVFSAISRDLLAGFAYGFAGSEKYGTQNSSAWMKASATGVFSHIQPEHSYYNPWANAIAANFADVYTFPFNDFLNSHAPEINVNSGDTLTVTLLSTGIGS